VEQKVAQAAQTLAGALPITEEQALALVKSALLIWKDCAMQMCRI
jgi:hypothetical protein